MLQESTQVPRADFHHVVCIGPEQYDVLVR